MARTAQNGETAGQYFRVTVSLPAGLRADLLKAADLCYPKHIQAEIKLSRFVTECVESHLAEHRLERAAGRGSYERRL